MLVPMCQLNVQIVATIDEGDNPAAHPFGTASRMLLPSVSIIAMQKSHSHIRAINLNYLAACTITYGLDRLTGKV